MLSGYIATDRMKQRRSRVFTLLILIFLTARCTNTHNANEHKTLPDPLEAGWEGSPVCEVMEENEKLRVLRCTFPPGTGHEKHFHDPHIGYTLAGGKFRMIDAEGTREVVVPTGYTFSNDSIIVHEVLNIGETTAQFLIIEYK